MSGWPATVERARLLRTRFVASSEVDVGGQHRVAAQGARAVGSTGARCLNMISAISVNDRPRLSIIDFCERLVPAAPGPVFLILDGHPGHRPRPSAFAERAPCCDAVERATNIESHRQVSYDLWDLQQQCFHVSSLDSNGAVRSLSPARGAG